MVFALNGIEIPIAAEEASFTAEPVGSHWRSPINGRLRRGVRAQKRTWRFGTTPLPVAGGVSAAYSALIEGAGESYPFDEGASLYSAQGAAPLSSANFAVGVIGSIKHGGGGLFLGASGQVTWPRTAVDFTVAFWVSDGVALASHYIVRRDGAKWVDGVRNDAASTPFLSTASSAVQLLKSGSIAYFDDLLVLPYLIPDAWAPQLYAAHDARALTLPRQVATGEFDPDGAAGFTVECTVDAVEQVRLADGLHETIAFTVREV